MSAGGAAAAEWRGVSVRYPFEDAPAVGPVDLAVGEGERVLLLGASGSGKSTLLLTLTGLVPNAVPATVDGSIRLFGEPVAARSPAGWAAAVAQLFQDADQSLCGMRVEDEIAFSLENRALPEDRIAEAVGAAMRRAGLPEAWRGRRVATLSGGERQLVALAAVLAQDSPLFVADEPTAHLAPAAADRLRRLLLDGAGGRGALVVDHRLDGLIEEMDRVVVLGGDGKVLAEGSPALLFRAQGEALSALGIWRPLGSLLDDDLRHAGLAPPEPPLTVAAALAHLDPVVAPADIIDRARPTVSAFVVARTAAHAHAAADMAPVARLAGADCAPFLGPTVLRNVDFVIGRGEVVGILGANGAGKSTLGVSLAGLLSLKGGRREGAPGGIAFQNPENQFVGGTVGEELESALGRNRPLAPAMTAEWGLDGLLERHPFELSQGQKRRLALATLALSDRWPLLVLDEPLAGLDAAGSAMVVRHVESLARAGRAIAIITHDMDFALRLCLRSIVLGDGRVLAEGRTADLLARPDLLARAGLAEPAIAPALRWLERVGAC